MSPLARLHSQIRRLDRTMNSALNSRFMNALLTHHTWQVSAHMSLGTNKT